MTNIQSILTIGSLALLGIISLNFNNNALENTTAEIENKVYLTAFSLADDLIEEIKLKSFDEKTIDFPSVNRTTLTQGSNFGPDGEAYPFYDDVDDYDGYNSVANAPHAESYNIHCDVNYVSETDPTSPSNTQTFHKRVDVTVTSPYLRHSINLNFVFTHK